MKQNEALKILCHWDRKGRYVFLKRDFAILFNEHGKKLDKTLERLAKSGILERVAHGVYLYSASAHIGAYTLDEIALALRRGEYVFESLESALSQWGRISQIPIDRITYMTTGRSGEFVTPFGVAEFSHTEANWIEINGNTVRRPNRRIPIATEEYALKNLRRVGRNYDLVLEMDAKNAGLVDV